MVDQSGLDGRHSRHRDGREIFRASEHAGRKKVSSHLITSSCLLILGDFFGRYFDN